MKYYKVTFDSSFLDFSFRSFFFDSLFQLEALDLKWIPGNKRGFRFAVLGLLRVLFRLRRRLLAKLNLTFYGSFDHAPPLVTISLPVDPFFSTDLEAARYARLFAGYLALYGSRDNHEID